MSKATILFTFLISYSCLFGQESKDWSFGVDLSFGITDQTFSQSGFTASSGLFDYTIQDKVSHGMHAGAFVRKRTNDRLHLRMGMYWQDLTTKRLYHNITYKQGVETPEDLGTLPDRTKIRSTYGFISMPIVAEYLIKRKRGLPYVFELGAGMNYNLYTLIRESAKYNGVRTVTREAYVDRHYSPFSVNAHLGMKATLAIGQNVHMLIGPAYEIFFQGLRVAERELRATSPRRFHLSTTFII